MSECPIHGSVWCSCPKPEDPDKTLKRAMELADTLAQALQVGRERFNDNTNPNEPLCPDSPDGNHHTAPIGSDEEWMPSKAPCYYCGERQTP